jgi:hypothetical protein
MGSVISSKCCRPFSSLTTRDTTSRKFIQCNHRAYVIETLHEKLRTLFKIMASSYSVFFSILVKKQFDQNNLSNCQTSGSGCGSHTERQTVLHSKSSKSKCTNRWHHRKGPAGRLLGTVRSEDRNPYTTRKARHETPSSPVALASCPHPTSSICEDETITRVSSITANQRKRSAALGTAFRRAGGAHLREHGAVERGRPPRARRPGFLLAVLRGIWVSSGVARESGGQHHGSRGPANRRLRRRARCFCSPRLG